jgi:hypothetical protein
MSRRVASTTFGLSSKRRTFWAVERPLGAACSSFTPLTASRHTWHAEQIRRMRNGMGRPRNWITADVVRVADGVLAEHWDVLQDEAPRAELKSGLPMFGTQFARERRLHSGADEMHCLPYLQGMPPQLTKSFSRALGKTTSSLTEASAIGPGPPSRGPERPLPCSAGRAANCEDHK